MANCVRLRASEGAPLDCLRGIVLGIYMDAQDRQECRPIPLFKDAVNSGGEGGIRTLGTLVRHTRFPVVHNRPLCHLSSQPGKNGLIKEERIGVVNA